MKRALALALSMALTGSLYAAEPPQDAPAKKVHTKTPSVSSQLAELKEAIKAQQKQIQDLGQQLQTRDQQVQQLQQRLDQNQAAATAAQSKADAVAAQDAQQDQSVAALKTDVSDLKLNSTSMAQTLQDTQKSLRDEFESPLAIHFKGVTITPGGYLAGESVYRNHALGADINTPFNSVNVPGAAQNFVSEFNGSGRQSRVSLLVEGKLKDLKLTGYEEADFLSAGVTSNNNQSNSYTLRQRQLWGQVAASNGWSLTGGQMWSLVTETKKGMDNRTEATPMTIDPQYSVGFSWARQYGVRVVKNFNDKFWLGASLENPSTTFSCGSVLTTTTGSSQSSTCAFPDFALGGSGNASGLYNSTTTYSFNSMPDFIFKAAAEPGFGHYEAFVILSRYRDRVYPCEELTSAINLTPLNCGSLPATAGAYNDSQSAGGFGANARVTLAKQFDIGLHFLTGQGVGRYGTGGLPDATANPDGTLALIRSTQALATVEWHSKRLDLYMNAGEEYAQRRDFALVNGTSGSAVYYGYGSPFFYEGSTPGILPATSGCYVETGPGAGGFSFGSPSAGSCLANTQRLIEGTVGFWFKAHSGPHGRLQIGPQYSYVVRDAWHGTDPTHTYFNYAPHGLDSMFFTSIRYYLP